MRKQTPKSAELKKQMTKDCKKEINDSLFQSKSMWCNGLSLAPLSKGPR